MTGDREMAVLLARIDARKGEWVTLDDLARHIECTHEITCMLLRRAEISGYVRLAREDADEAGFHTVFAATSMVQPAPLA